MNVLIVHRYYWPDTAPAATIFRTVARRWVADGHDVTVFSAQPSYTEGAGKQPRRERLDGSQVIRAALLPETKTDYVRRAINFGVFFTKALLHVLRSRKYDVIVALTVPPILPAAILGAAARFTGAQLVYQCMDIFPELGVHSGLMEPGRKYDLMRRLDARNVRHAGQTVVLSRDMKQLLVDRGANPDEITIINNVDIEEFSDADTPPPALTKDAGQTQVLFAGNLGRFQGLDTIISAAHQLADTPSIRFDFLGSGIMQSELESQSGDLLGHSVHFHGRVSASAAAEAAKNADIVLITLAPGVIRAAYPSKTMTYLRAGTPIVALVESDSELGEMIETQQLGAIAEPGDADGLAAAITTIANADTAEISAIRERCRNVYTERFHRDVLLDKWSTLLRSIEVETGR